MQEYWFNGIVFLCFLCGAGIAQAQAPDGAAIYRQRCAVCHDNPQERVPSRDTIASLPLQVVTNALTTGSMKEQAAGLSAAEIQALAGFVTGRTAVPPSQQTLGTIARAPAVANPAVDVNANRCANDPPARLGGTMWNGWGRDLGNSRYQPDPGIKADDVPKLKVKWAFAYPGALAQGQPTIVGDRLYVTSESGAIFSLDAQTGCTHWVFQADSGSRSAVTVGPLPGSRGKLAAYFGDMQGAAYAVDASTGQRIWKISLEQTPYARITGAPALYNGRLYVPVSSEEETTGSNVHYECCKFRGSVAALDARTGKVIWRIYPIQDAPKPFKKNPAGTQMYGPAGASIWSSPTIDEKRKLLYVGTGDSYTDVPTDASDAIVAMDLKTGAIKWVNQVTANDNYVVGCRAGTANCPNPVGPDYDFGSSPILRKLPNGKDVILAGQKSGVLYALDPDARGRTLWQVQVGPGSALGGIEWGFAADEETVYVPIANPSQRPNLAAGGVSALKIEGGQIRWHTSPPMPVCAWGTQRCIAAHSQAVTVIPGVLFSGSLDGHLRAYATKDGAIIWDFDTAAKFEAVNGVAATGGSLDNGGPTVANGILYVNSGYGRIIGRRGNALLAFTVDGK
jgi:polyvinyl alcohol dehydrogenase (cytochrome)